MNGCCYGGLCTMPWAITFPQQSAPHTDTESPPYDHQHRLGLLHGIRLKETSQSGPPVVAQIRDHQGPAARAGLREGDRVTRINGQDINSMQDAMIALVHAGPQLTLLTVDGRTVQWSIGAFPARSLPVSPTQIYATINAAVIFLFLFAYYPFRRRDGEVIAILLTIYPATRFLLEMVRDDESGVFGIWMTISQVASLLLVALAVGLWVYVLRRRPDTAFAAWPATS